jgi:hypothetical protein
MDINSVFVGEAPSNQNVIDMFGGEWSSSLPLEARAISTPGHADLFADPRIAWAHQVLGPFDGKTVLELGPLEGAHTYMLERYGVAAITSIEANTRAFLKCLCMKEILDLRQASFKLGNFVPFLKECGNYDIILASGVLYHMTDPIELLQLIMKRTDRVILWTHYFNDLAISRLAEKEMFMPPKTLPGTAYVGSKRIYPQVSLDWKGFSGGIESHAVWLERDSLLRCFEDRGFDVHVNFEQTDHPNGPALSLCATRR